MKELFQRVKMDMVVSAVLCTVLGLVLVIWPQQTIDIVCKALAVGLVILGIVNLASYFGNRGMHPFSGALGLIVILVGIWIFLSPESIVSVVPIVIGVILVLHGVHDIKMAIETKQNGYDRWWAMLLIAIVSLVFGVLCIVNAFGVVTLAMQFVGVALIYDGVTDLWVVTKAARTAKRMQEEADALDVEYRESDDN